MQEALQTGCYCYLMLLDRVSPRLFAFRCFEGTFYCTYCWEIWEAQAKPGILLSEVEASFKRIYRGVQAKEKEKSEEVRGS